MEVRDSYKREFLDSLRDSPAWELLITQMLREMHFIQDDVKFKRNGLAYKTYLSPEIMYGKSGTLKSGEKYKVLVDNIGNKLKYSDGLISNDGISWKLEEVVKNEFYIMPQRDVNQTESYLQIIGFHPNHLSCNDMKQLLSVFGIYHENVTFSSFDTIFSATSPYLLHYVLTRSEIPYRKNYIFLDASEVELEGSTIEYVREGIYIKRAHLNQFYFESELTLIPGKDYIVYNGNEYAIESVNKNTIVTTLNVAEGIFDIKRYEYIVPLAPDMYLTSTLELVFGGDVDLNTAYRIIDRVTPIRCTQGFKGKVNVRVYSDFEIKVDGAPLNKVKRTLVNLFDEISFMENQLLYNGPRPVRENGIQLMDIGVVNTLYEEIYLE